MCGIAFGKPEIIKTVFHIQSQRGTDGFGLITAENTLHKYLAEDLTDFFYQTNKLTEPPSEVREMHYVDSKKAPITYMNYRQFYRDMAFSVSEKMKQDEYGLLHHRKASVGNISIENTHPYIGKRFFLIQNGTDHKFHEWGVLEGIPDTFSDSHMLLEFIERKCNTLEEIIPLFTRIWKMVTFGVIIIGEIHGDNRRLLYYSDGLRACYIEKDKLNPNKIDFIRSMKDDSLDETKCEGHMIFDWNGNILLNDIDSVNTRKVVSTASSSSTFASSSATQKSRIDSYHTSSIHYAGYQDPYDFEDIFTGQVTTPSTLPPTKLASIEPPKPLQASSYVPQKTPEQMTFADSFLEKEIEDALVQDILLTELFGTPEFVQIIKNLDIILKHTRNPTTGNRKFQTELQQDTYNKKFADLGELIHTVMPLVKNEMKKAGVRKYKRKEIGNKVSSFYKKYASMKPAPFTQAKVLIS